MEVWDVYKVTQIQDFELLYALKEDRLQMMVLIQMVILHTDITLTISLAIWLQGCIKVSCRINSQKNVCGLVVLRRPCPRGHGALAGRARRGRGSR